MCSHRQLDTPCKHTGCIIGSLSSISYSQCAQTNPTRDDGGADENMERCFGHIEEFDPGKRNGFSTYIEHTEHLFVVSKNISQSIGEHLTKSFTGHGRS